MCTLTSRRSNGDLVVTMNRDEARSRAEELPPKKIGASPIILAPRDGQAEGTWFGVNDRGVVAGLLNLYPDGIDEPPPSGTATRGELVDHVLQQENIEESIDWMRNRCDPIRYSPFRIALFSTAEARLFTWRGIGVNQENSLEEVPLDEEWTLLSSSSWRSREVLPWREDQFHLWRSQGAPHCGTLPEFHRMQPTGLAEWAPLMARANASTRSITQVEIKSARSQVTLRYWPRPEGADFEGASFTEENPWQAQLKLIRSSSSI